MTRVIAQRIRLDATPRTLYDAYLHAPRHAAITGRTVRIRPRVGASFSAFNGLIRGKNLVLVPGRMIVQAWRSTHWRKHDPDSILVLLFTKVARGAEIHLTHVNVPNYDYAGVKKGWHTYYWKPWRAYLNRTRRR